MADLAERLEFRVTADEKAQWEETAKLLGLSLSEFIRRACNARPVPCDDCGGEDSECNCDCGHNYCGCGCHHAEEKWCLRRPQ